MLRTLIAYVARWISASDYDAARAAGALREIARGGRHSLTADPGGCVFRDPIGWLIEAEASGNRLTRITRVKTPWGDTVRFPPQREASLGQPWRKLRPHHRRALNRLFLAARAAQGDAGAHAALWQADGLDGDPELALLSAEAGADR